MTELEWLACNDPQPMLEYLSGKVSDRKLRLFAAARVRRIWRLLIYNDSRNSVQLGERYADGLATTDEVMAFHFSGRGDVYLGGTGSPNHTFWSVYIAGETACSVSGLGLTEHPRLIPRLTEKAADAVALDTHNDPSEESEEGWAMWRQGAASTISIERACQAVAVRDIFGNPFRPVAFDPAWRTPSVSAVAQTIYTERRFADLPILADALEEAGCGSGDHLDHCRSGGEHVRGCWVLDLVLDKE